MAGDLSEQNRPFLKPGRGYGVCGPRHSNAGTVSLQESSAIPPRWVLFMSYGHNQVITIPLMTEGSACPMGDT